VPVRPGGVGLLPAPAVGGRSRSRRSGPETETQRRRAMAELFVLHRLLAVISNNVNQIARVANVTGEVSAGAVVTVGKVREVADRVDAAVEGLSLS